MFAMKLPPVVALLFLIELLPIGILAYSSPHMEQETDSSRNLRGSDEKISVLVKYKTDQGKEQAKNKASKVNYESRRFNVIAVDVAQADLEDLKNDPNVVHVDLDQMVFAVPPVTDDALGVQAQTAGRPNLDDDLDEQMKTTKPKKPHSKDTPTKRRQLEEQVPWGISAVQADQVTPGPFAHDIKVCVVDTGYDMNHTDLPGRDTVNGNDSVEIENSESLTGHKWDVDGNGHGTHCAGTIVAIGTNEIGVMGVIPDANPNGITVHIGKGLDDYGYGSISSVIEAVEECIDADADIISMSLGMTGYSQTLEEALLEAYKDDGILLVAAANNNGNTALSYPASFGSVMSVGAVEESSHEAAWFSQNNRLVEIAAPGVHINSTLPGDAYAELSGTSQATPHVSGIAALVWSHNSTCTAQQIRRILLASAMDLGRPACDYFFGHGMVQAKDAIELLMSGGCSVADEMPLLDADGMNIDGSLCDTCQQGTKTMTLHLQTDNYPTETSWEVVDSDGWQVGRGSGYSDRGVLVNEEVTVCKGRSYQFTIFDEWGDGICCDFGSGSYTVMVGEEMVKENGGIFGASETTPFDVPGPPTALPSATPSIQPSTDPTIQPSTTPTTQPSAAPSTTPSIQPSTNASVQPSTTPTTQPSAAPTSRWEEITFDDFENGRGNFKRKSQSEDKYAKYFSRSNDTTGNDLIPFGNGCFRIGLDEGAKSSFFHEYSHDVTPYSKIRVSFSFQTSEMKRNKNDLFVLQYSSDDGSSWTDRKQFKRAGDFKNRQVYNETVRIDKNDASFYFTNQAKIRFRCKANAGYVYIDDVTFEGLLSNDEHIQTAHTGD